MRRAEATSPCLDKTFQIEIFFIYILEENDRGGVIVFVHLDWMEDKSVTIHQQGRNENYLVEIQN